MSLKKTKTKTTHFFPFLPFSFLLLFLLPPPFPSFLLPSFLFKNSSIAPTITKFIPKIRQATLLHDLPLQLCPRWPLFAAKERYTGLDISTLFQRFCNHEGQKKFARRFRGDFVFRKNLLAFFQINV